MNNKKCARCEKTVYPIEELKCLDKIWHKTCFKCYECGMILNMKTYKGFNKLPYCNAHTPQARATTVADTPETRRLAENTKIQSQVKYHEEFEKQKGKLTQVADDPETLRIRNTSKIISNATYHGEYEKKKQMEERRNQLSTDNVVNNNTHQPQYIGHSAGKESKAAKNAASCNNNPHLSQLSLNAAPIDNYQQRNVYYVNNNNGNQMEPNQDYYKTASTGAKVPVPSPSYTASNVNYVVDPRYGNATMYQHHMAMPGYQQQVKHPAQYHQQMVQQYRSAYHDNIKYFPAMQQTAQKPVYTVQNLGRCFRAIYDYTAQDTDEVSFVDGDLIINCQPIDDGWMTGTVQRTGKTGMLPSNYVESA